MGEKLDFPGNFDRFLRFGYEALEAGEDEAAVEEFIAAYELQQDFAVNLLIVTISLEIGQYKQALNYALERVDEYVADLRYFPYYIEALGQNKLFLTARKLLLAKQKTADKRELQDLEQIENKIDLLETVTLMKEKESIKRIRDLLQKLPAMDAAQQLYQVKQARYLPLKEFVEYGQVLLCDPQVHILARTWLVEELVRLEWPDKVAVIDYLGKAREIIPQKLKTPEQEPLLQQIEAELNQLLANEDPILLVSILDELKVVDSFLYPFMGEVTPDPKRWAVGYLSDYGYGSFSGGEDLELTAVRQKIAEETGKLF